MAIGQVLVSSDGMSAVINKPVNICDVCGFQWNREPGRKYTRCASQKCRSVHWNAGKKFVAEWQKREKKPGRPRLKRGPKPKSGLSKPGKPRTRSRKGR
jgi:hypothetical protein